MTVFTEPPDRNVFSAGDSTDRPKVFRPQPMVAAV